MASRSSNVSRGALQRLLTRLAQADTGVDWHALEKLELLRSMDAAQASMEKRTGRERDTLHRRIHGCLLALMPQSHHSTQRPSQNAHCAPVLRALDEQVTESATYMLKQFEADNIPVVVRELHTLITLLELVRGVGELQSSEFTQCHVYMKRFVLLLSDARRMCFEYLCIPRVDNDVHVDYIKFCARYHAYRTPDPPKQRYNWDDPSEWTNMQSFRVY